MTVELPKDTEGREIPLDTSEMFIADGTMVHVVKFEYIYYTCDASGSWFVHFNRTSGEHMTLQPCDVHLTPPDSWEKLLDDLDRVVENKDSFYSTACAYMNKGVATCNDCRLHGHNTSSCTDEMFKDVVSRIRKLRGED